MDISVVQVETDATQSGSWSLIDHDLFTDMQDGDVFLFVAVLYSGGQDAATFEPTPDAEQLMQSTAGWDINARVGLWIYDEIDLPAQYFGYIPAALGGEMAFLAVQLRGVDTTSLPAVTWAYSTGEADPNPTAEPLTTTEDGQVMFTTRHLVNSAQFAHPTSGVGGPPSGFTHVASKGTEQGWPDDVYAEVAMKTIATAGTETPGDWSGATETGHTEWAVLSFALEAAAGGGGGGGGSSLSPLNDRSREPRVRRFL